MGLLRWPTALLILISLATLSVFGPKPVSENSLYRLLDEPLESTRALRIDLEHFPSQEDRLGAVISLGARPGLKELKAALDATYRLVPEIREQRSLFELRTLSANDEEDLIFYPKVDNADEAKAVLQQVPIASFFYNPDRRMAYVEWTIRSEGSDASVPDVLLRVSEGLRATLGEETDISFGGPYFVDFEFQRGLRQNIVLGIASAASLFFLFLILFRTWLVIFVPIVIVLVQGVLTSGMAVLGHKLSPLTSCLLLLMTVSIVEDFVFLFFVRVRQASSFREAARKIGRASFLTSLTTAVGFGALVLNDSPKIIEFAIWAVVGTSLEWVLTMVVCPPLLDRWTPQQGVGSSRALQHIENGVRRLNEFSSSLFEKRPLGLRLAIVASFLASVFLLPKALVGYDAYETFSKGHPAGQFLERMKEMNHVAGDIRVLFPRAIGEEKMSQIRSELRRQKDWKVVGWEDFLPRSVDHLSIEARQMVRREFARSDELDSFVSDRAERLSVYLPRVDSEYLAGVTERVRKICQDDCLATGETLVLNEISVSFLDKLYRSLGGSLLIVGVILLIVAFRYDREQWLAMVASSFWGPMMFLGTIILLGTRINVTICLCITTFVGLAGDSAIQFIIDRRRRLNLRNSIDVLSPASALTFLMMSMVSLTFAFSLFAVTRRLAWLFPLGFLFLYIGDILVLQLFLKTKSQDAGRASGGRGGGA